MAVATELVSPQLTPSVFIFLHLPPPGLTERVGGNPRRLHQLVLHAVCRPVDDTDIPTVRDRDAYPDGANDERANRAKLENAHRRITRSVNSGRRRQCRVKRCYVLIDRGR